MEVGKFVGIRGTCGVGEGDGTIGMGVGTSGTGNGTRVVGCPVGMTWGTGNGVVGDNVGVNNGNGASVVGLSVGFICGTGTTVVGGNVGIGTSNGTCVGSGKGTCVGNGKGTSVGKTGKRKGCGTFTGGKVVGSILTGVAGIGALFEVGAKVGIASARFIIPHNARFPCSS